jgi:predicted RNase H-like HicB family nuclease
MATTWGIMHHENGVVGVSFPDFPGCITGAETEEEAARKADEVLTFHVAGMVEDGDPIPSSRTQKELLEDPEFVEGMQNGGVLLLVRYELPKKAIRINISMDESLIEAIDRAAEHRGQSRSAFLAEAARARLKNAA